MIDWTAIIIAIALLIANAFFVGAEFALIAARRTQIEPIAAGGSRTARMTLRAMERVSLMMAGAQLGITMCSLGLGAIGEPAVAHVLEIPLAKIGVTGPALHTVAFIIALAIVVFLHMVLGEMLPKNIAIATPERSAMVLGPILYVIVFVLRPLIWVMNTIANLVLKLIRVEPREEVASAFTADEVAAFIAESRDEGLLGEADYQLLSGSLTMGTETAQQVMVPLADLVTLTHDTTPAAAAAAFAQTRFSRFPVTSDEGVLVGYVHLKDLIGLNRDDNTTPIDERLIRPLATIDKDATLEATLASMQAGGTHFALVVDGDQPIGAAMLEDVVERLIGEVSEAH